MSYLTEYKIFCLSEKRVARGYTDGLLLPLCPNNHNHIVAPDTLVKIGELGEEYLESTDYYQQQDKQLIVVGGMTGIETSSPLDLTFVNISYPGMVGINGDILDGYINNEQYLHLPLTTDGGSIKLDRPIPAHTVNELRYYNNGQDKIFNFTTTYRY